MIILTCLLLPLLTITTLLCAQIGLTVVTKMQLQVTADRAAYAAANQQATDLGTVALLNWKIRQEFVGQQRDFGISQQRDDGDGKARLASRQNKIDNYRDEMAGLLRDGYRRACDAALATVAAAEAAHTVPPATKIIPLSGHMTVAEQNGQRRCVVGATDRLFTFGDDNYADDQWPTLNYSYPEGGSIFFDPAKVGHSSGELLQYRIKPRGTGQQVAFALRLTTPDLPNFLTPIWPTLVRNPDLVPTASAAAQPVGGSVDAGAWIEATDESAWREVYDARAYQPTLVPMRRLQDRDADYAGLEWYDDATESWKVDGDAYAH